MLKFQPELDFQAFPEHVPCLRLVRVVQLLPGQVDSEDDNDYANDDVCTPGQNQDVVFDEGSVEPEVERTLLVILWHLGFGKKK